VLCPSLPRLGFEHVAGSVRGEGWRDSEGNERKRHKQATSKRKTQHAQLASLIAHSLVLLVPLA